VKQICDTNQAHAQDVTAREAERMIPKIQFTKGCLNECPYCYEKPPIVCLDPKIPEDPEIQILDMNFLCNPQAKEILRSLPKRRWEFVCGLDFRRMDPEICQLLKEKGFIKIRWAWDYGFSSQRKHQHIWRMLKNAGFRPEDLSVFIIANWKIPYSDCLKKLELLKVWGVKVNDCCFDGGYKIAKPLYWDIDQIKRFRAACRKHNQLVRFKIDPEVNP
jgi:hypothetical protein